MQKSLVLDEAKAKELYPTASPEFKIVLENTFGIASLGVKITDRIASWEDVCRLNGIDPNDAKFRQGEADEIAYKMLKEIALCYNQGWKPNWNNSSERKWFAWWYMDSPGFRLHGIVFGYSASRTTGGSRLCFSSEELARHAANTFKNIYKQFIATPDDKN